MADPRNMQYRGATGAHIIDADRLLADPGGEAARKEVQVVIEGGRIAAINSSASSSAPSSRRLVLPALSNAHDHARTFRSATLGAFARPLEGWLPFLGVTPPADPYLGAATSFARSVRHGVSHLMVHYTRVQGSLPYVDEVEAVARAARDVGVNIGFAVAISDRHAIGYADDATVLQAVRPAIRDEVAARLKPSPLTPADYLARVDDVGAMLQAGGYTDHVTLQYGPGGVQWCSTPLLSAIAQASADTGRPVHMHLLETRYQRDWADRTFPDGLVRYLDDIGLLSPRLTLAHCVWARPDELALLAERGVTIAINTSSNLGIRSGIAPVGEMLRQGCRVAMGLDGLALDEDDDALREMRLAYALHRGWGYDVAMTPADLWRFAARNGRRSVVGMAGEAREAGTLGDMAVGASSGRAARFDSNGVGHIASSTLADTATVSGGRLVAGAPADLLVLDWDAVDDDALFDDVDPLDILLARAHAGHLQDVYIGGRKVVEAGRVITVDEVGMRKELIAQVRASLKGNAAAARWKDVVGHLADDLGPFYRNSPFGGCC
ncbi:amidohydrolase family protein [Pigmentiphaga litoralis]|uniref:Cytosine/adenosine deaminase-related metal-dependent hydrolase n=1 Tax=Pigmentiphaga litoralis TaxID=516702 RepID=A0A7Y9LPM6_9BURK|nr:amidohydrolase family protein [Pigmentiphaga litoralis]NYE26992.1 cytosine/adenosine deaminase-related metal-dependent hydrolase [Pigmentiphaga litoralis]NYE86147.1 cytosine/adenosine deaminase-related metal-dependent hydrolase [Pigmentiphaga litoralis]